MITYYKGYLISQCWPQKFHLNASINYDQKSSHRSIDGSAAQCVGTFHGFNLVDKTHDQEPVVSDAQVPEPSLLPRYTQRSSFPFLLCDP